MTGRPPGRSGARRRPSLAAAVVVGLGTIVVAGLSFALSQVDRSKPQPSAVTPTTSGASVGPPLVSGMPDSRSYLDASVAGSPSDPLGPTTLHPLAAVEGRTWAALLDPRSGQTRLDRLAADGGAFEDTGRVVDERPGAVADMVWAGGHLFVATVVRDRAVGSGVRLSRFSPDPRAGFRPDADFPIALTERGVRAMSFTRDAAGRLWLAVVRDGTLEIAHSTTNDANWTAPAALVGAPALGNDDVATLVPFGSGRLGIVWTAAASNAVQFAWRSDADKPDAWSGAETVASNVPLLRDPISAVAGPDGSVLVSVAGDVRGSGSSPDAPRLMVARRDAGGTWSATVAGRVVDRHGPAAVLSSEPTGEIELLATQGATGSSWVLKRSRPDRLEFESGPGTPIASPVGISSLDLGGPHLASGPSSADEVVVLGFDTTLGRYVHAVITRAGAAPGPSASPGAGPSASAGGPQPSGSGSGPVAALPLAVIDDTFDVFAPGVTAPNGWLPRSGEPPSRIVVETAPGHGRVLTLRSTATDSVRACKDFTAVSTGTLTATVLLRLDRLGTADATITSLRLHGNEAALVRFGVGGTFAYYSGATKVRTTVRWKLGAWYQSTVRVDLGRRTYDWELALPGARAPLVRAARIPFRDPAATSIDSICVQTSAGRANLGLTVDRVVVTR